jgi:hypothetical protein
MAESQNQRSVEFAQQTSSCLAAPNSIFPTDEGCRNKAKRTDFILSIINAQQGLKIRKGDK